MELTKLRLKFDEIIGYNNREFNDILWAWVKRNANNISNFVEAPVMQKIAERKRRFTEEEEKYIWWGVQWAFKPENKNRIFKQKEFFDYVYWEMDV